MEESDLVNLLNVAGALRSYGHLKQPTALQQRHHDQLVISGSSSW